MDAGRTRSRGVRLACLVWCGLTSCAPPASVPAANETQAAAAPEPSAASADGGAPPDCAPLDRDAVIAAFDAVDVQACKRSGGPTGAGLVHVVYVPATGLVRSVVLEHGPFSGRPEGTCIVAAFRATRIPPFCPSDSTVNKPFVIH